MNSILASMIFLSVRDYTALPEQYGLSQEEAWFETADRVRLHGWYFDAKEKDTSTKLCLIAFHGNATNVSGLLPIAKEWTARGISVLLMEYRGYGKSEGSIKKGTDVFEDARAGVKWLQKEKQFSPSDIVLYGQSIGSAAAVQLATETPFKALVLEAPFNSLKALGKLHYGLSFDFLFKDFPYENELKISNIKCPLFIMHGTKDETCPFWMGQRLYQNAVTKKEFFEVPNAFHNDLQFLAGADFFDRPVRFVKGLGEKGT